MTNQRTFIIPTKFEFQEYIPEKKVQSSGSLFDFFFGKEKKSNEIHIEERFNIEITSLTNNLWEGKNIPQEQIVNFLKLMKDKKCRLFFIYILSKFRIKGLFTLEDNSFHQLGYILNKILDEVYENKDYEVFKKFFILTQTYYKKPQSSDEEKVYVQILIEDHKLCHDIDFWENICKYAIFEEYSNQHDLPVYSSDSPQEMKTRHQNLVFGQLISYSYNILTFGISKEKIKSLMEKFVQEYELSSEYKKMLELNIDEYVSPTPKNIYDHKLKDLHEIKDLKETDIELI